MFHLVIVELAVLQVGRRGDCAHTCVGVVVRVLTHTVWETLLDRRHTTTENREFFCFISSTNELKVSGRTDTPGPSSGQAGSDTLLPSPSYSTRMSVLQLLLFTFPSW